MDRLTFFKVLRHQFQKSYKKQKDSLKAVITQRVLKILATKLCVPRWKSFATFIFSICLILFFQSAFKNTFQKASTDDWQASQPLKTDPTPAWKKELDARVANINKAVQEIEQKEGKSSERTDAESELPRRKSRWQTWLLYCKLYFTDQIKILLASLFYE